MSDNRYSQCIVDDGCGVRCDGVLMTIDEIVARLNELEKRPAVNDGLENRLLAAIEQGTPPGDCWIRKHTVVASIRAALRQEGK